MCFNPHTREGCDRVDPPDAASIFVSIHTPAKGVTLVSLSCDNIISVSIHTPAKGVTVACDSAEEWFEVSIHTPAKGVTILR